MSLGFEVTSEDIAAILSRHSLYVTNTGGVSFPAMAEQLLAAGYIDEDLVEKVALAASDDEDDDIRLAKQTKAAYVEMVRQLCEAGVFGHDLTDLETQFQSSTTADSVKSMRVAPVRSNFTVLFVEEGSGKIGMRHVQACDGNVAFAAVAKTLPGVEFVAAIPGKLTEDAGLVFPGESLVSSETVLDQPEVFGDPVQGMVLRPDDEPSSSLSV